MGKIPAKYRKKAKVVGGENTGPQVTDITETPKVKGKREGASDAGERASAGELEKKKAAVYGGKDAKVWRDEFGRNRADLKAAEKQLVELRSRMSDTSKMSRVEYLTLQNTVRQVEYRVLELRKNQDALNESADKAGVPAELRE